MLQAERRSAEQVRIGRRSELPTYPKGSFADGTIQLSGDVGGELVFGIRVSGHGASLTAELQRKW